MDRRHEGIIQNVYFFTYKTLYFNRFGFVCDA